MGTTIGDLLPFALGVAISPLPIVAVILMLLTPNAERNGSAFACGWMIGLITAGGLTLALADVADVGGDGTSSDISAAIMLVLGFVLIGLVARRRWIRLEPVDGDQPDLPKWMSGIDRMSAFGTFGLAFMFAGVKPKNLILAIGAGLTIARADLSTGGSITALAIFVLLASLTVAGPVVLFLLAGDRLRPTLDTWKAWLVANNATVMSVLLLVFGVILIGKGVSGLTA